MCQKLRIIQCDEFYHDKDLEFEMELFNLMNSIMISFLVLEVELFNLMNFIMISFLVLEAELFNLINSIMIKKII